MWNHFTEFCQISARQPNKAVEMEPFFTKNTYLDKPRLKTFQILSSGQSIARQTRPLYESAKPFIPFQSRHISDNYKSSKSNSDEFDGHLLHHLPFEVSSGNMDCIRDDGDRWIEVDGGSNSLFSKTVVHSSSELDHSFENPAHSYSHSSDECTYDGNNNYTASALLRARCTTVATHYSVLPRDMYYSYENAYSTQE